MDYVDLTTAELKEQIPSNVDVHWFLNLLKSLGKAERVGFQPKLGRGKPATIWRIPNPCVLTFNFEKEE